MSGICSDQLCVAIVEHVLGYTLLLYEHVLDIPHFFNATVTIYFTVHLVSLLFEGDVYSRAASIPLGYIQT